MKFASLGLLRVAVVPLAITLVICSSTSAHAGWGVLRAGGSSGAYAAGYGSSGAVGASSGGYAAAYGSSGYTAGGSSGYSAAYGSSGYAAAYGSSGAYASVGGSSGRPGLLNRLSAHMAAKRARHAARRAAYASSGGSTGYGSSGYVAAHSGGSSGAVAYSGGSSGSVYRSSSVSYSGGSSGSSSYAPAYSAPVSHGSSGGSTYYGVSNSAKAPLTAFASNVDEDAVQLTVTVPSEAKVFVNGRETTSKGSVRQFVSRGLKEDKTYKFEIEAHLEAADGQDMIESKTVVVQAGQTESLDFAFAEYDKPIETALTLNVPEGAEVMLGGNDTKAIGATRTYRTKQLKPGQVWDDYEVTVRVGDQVKQQSVRLIAGDQLQLSFNFDEDPSKLVSR